jgi:hypothetical protein
MPVALKACRGRRTFRLLDLASEPNRCWVLDFLHDALHGG